MTYKLITKLEAGVGKTTLFIDADYILWLLNSTPLYLDLGQQI